MATDLSIYLRSLIGAKPFLEFKPGTDRNPGISFPTHDDRDIEKELLAGEDVVVERVVKQRVSLALDPVSQSEAQTLEEMKDTRQDVCVCPPWTEDAIAYLGLNGGLEDMREPLTQSAVTFARKCRKANSVTGVWSAFDIPTYENCGPGQGIHISDVANYLDYISFEDKVYMSAAASDNANTTDLTFASAAAIARYAAGHIILVATEGETANSIERAVIDSITAAVMTVKRETVDAANGTFTKLVNTSDYVRAKKAYISNLRTADASMDEDGLGSWIDYGSPELKEKSKTQRETGDRALRFISNATTEGFTQTLGIYPSGEDLVFRIRAKPTISGEDFTVEFYNTTDSESLDTESSVDHLTAGSWGWMIYCVQIDPSDSGKGKEIQLRIGMTSGDSKVEAVIDRFEILQNAVVNGGMEGTYVDEDGGETHDVAPSWGKLNAGAGDVLDESADEHGGAKAQQIDCGAAGEGVETDGDPFASGSWYLVGAFFKVVSGEAEMVTESGNSLITAIDDASYAFHATIWEGDAAEKLHIRCDGTAADFLVDDVMVIRLPGNPFDDAYYDLPEPLSTTEFSISGIWKPDMANTALTTDVQILELSRRIYDASNRIQFYYDESATRFTFRTVVGGSAASATVSTAFSAGDNIYWDFKKDSVNGMKLFIKVGSAAAATGTSVETDFFAGCSRAWLKFGADYRFAPRGASACVLIENTELSDADKEAIIDRFSEDKWLNIVKKVDGIQFRPDYSLTPYAGDPDQLFGSCSLRERARNVGAVIATQD